MHALNDSVVLLLPGGQSARATITRRYPDGTVDVTTPQTYLTPDGPCDSFRAEASVAYQYMRCNCPSLQER